MAGVKERLLATEQGAAPAGAASKASHKKGIIAGENFTTDGKPDWTKNFKEKSYFQKGGARNGILDLTA